MPRHFQACDSPQGQVVNGVLPSSFRKPADLRVHPHVSSRMKSRQTTRIPASEKAPAAALLRSLHGQTVSILLSMKNDTHKLRFPFNSRTRGLNKTCWQKRLDRQSKACKIGITSFIMYVDRALEREQFASDES